MSELVKILIFTGGAGICIFLGGLAASFENIRPHWLQRELRHFLIAFGGGVLLGAVAFVLVPEGSHYVKDPWLVVLALLTGGVLFLFIEQHLSQKGTQTPNLMGMLLDFIPEALALGGLIH